MSTIIKFDLKELRSLAADKSSCIIEKKVSQHLALQPWCLGNLKESVKNLLDYKIGKFDKEFNGIVLSYKNLRILHNVGSIKNDNADIHFQVQTDYYIFRPYIGATLQGIVNKKSVTHLGVLVHRVFNVVIPRPTEEPGMKWIGESVQEGQEVAFKVLVLDLYGALPYIRGELDDRSLKLVDEEDDKQRPVNVSYVNFDKTKPHAQKQIGDGIPDSNKMKPFRTKCKIEASKTLTKTPSVSNGRCSKERLSETKSNSKIKNKKQGKVSEPQEITSRQQKKQRREQ